MSKRMFVSLSLLLMLAVSICAVSTGSGFPEERGPRIDTLQFKVVRGPQAQFVEMVKGPPKGSDVWEHIAKTEHIEALGHQGKTISHRSSFHVCYFGFNYRRPPLNDVNFRHALAHLLPKDYIIERLLKYAAVKVDTKVPPAQALWYNHKVDSHPYSPAEAEAILAAAVLPDGNPKFAKIGGVWKYADGSEIPMLWVYAPSETVAPTTYKLVEVFVEKCHEIGLLSVQLVSGDYWIMLMKIYYLWDFDIFFTSRLLGRFPTHLYPEFHSSQNQPGSYNPHGIVYPELDAQLEILWTSLDHTAKVAAAKKAQELLAGGTTTDPLPKGIDTTNHPRNQTIPIIPLYSRITYDAQQPELRGAVNMFGYGISNIWTWMNIHWNTPNGYRPGTTERKVVVIKEDYPERLNPTYASHEYAWNFMRYVYDSLIAPSPYTHRDEPWLATNWSYAAADGGMDVTFDLRLTDSQGQSIKWQDGKDISIEDIKFSWGFLERWQIPKYLPSMQFYDPENTVIIDQDTIRARMTTTSQWLVYSLADLAYMFPPQVWTKNPIANREWLSTDEILNFDPSAYTYPRAGNVGPGPISLPTQVFGTGPFVLQHSTDYIVDNGHGDLKANRNYFKTTAEIMDLIEYMFWRAGDVIDDDKIDGADLGAIGEAYDTEPGDAKWNVAADVTGPLGGPPDEHIDIDDLMTAGRFFGETETVPYEHATPP